MNTSNDRSNVFLSGTTAASVLRGIYAPGSQGSTLSEWAQEAGLWASEEDGLLSQESDLAIPDLGSASSSIRRIRSMLSESRLPPDCLGTTPELVFGSAAGRPLWGEVKSRVWSTGVPSGSFVEVGGALYVSSPSFVFVQRASELGLFQTIAYGNELCGCYSLDSSPRGFNDHPPFVTPAGLREFLAACKNGKGAKIARVASKWVLPGFRSPMESDTYLLTCLPRNYGGYGIIAKPEVNAHVAVPEGLWYLTEVRSYEVDLLWREALAAVEYDGDVHDERSQRLRDDAKTHVLEEMGYLVIRINWDILRDPREFDRRVRLLATRLGQTVPPSSAEFARRRRALREALFRPPLR